MIRIPAFRAAAALASLAAIGVFAQSQVVPPAATARVAREDGQLLGAIVSALAADPVLQGAELQVEVDEGVVGITGHAESEAQAQRAGQVAAQAAGGARVETDIDVQPSL